MRAATLAITALGIYDAEINGQSVGDQVFAPGWTEYRKRVPYQTYDVAALLHPGENVLGAILGDGWYCGNVAFHPRQYYGRQPGLLAQLHVVLADGTEQTLASGTDWKTTTGPILESDFLHGESYDARLDLGPWSSPGYDAGAWLSVAPLPRSRHRHRARHRAAPCGGWARSCPSITTSRRRSSVRVSQCPSTAPGVPDRKGKPLIFDLGQNFSGRVRITVRAKAGQDDHLALRGDAGREGIALHRESAPRPRH